MTPSSSISIIEADFSSLLEPSYISIGLLNILIEFCLSVDLRLGSSKSYFDDKNPIVGTASLLDTEPLFEAVIGFIPYF